MKSAGRTTPFLYLFEPNERILVEKIFRSGLRFKDSPYTLIDHVLQTCISALADPDFTDPELHVYKRLKNTVTQWDTAALLYACSLFREGARPQEVTR